MVNGNEIHLLKNTSLGLKRIEKKIQFSISEISVNGNCWIRISKLLDLKESLRGENKNLD